MPRGTVYVSALNMETVRFSETLVPTCMSTRRYKPDDHVNTLTVERTSKSHRLILVKPMQLTAEVEVQTRRCLRVMLMCKKKGKVVPLRSIEAHLGDRRYSSYCF
jgi:hypothetical protein